MRTSWFAFSMVGDGSRHKWGEGERGFCGRSGWLQAAGEPLCSLRSHALGRSPKVQLLDTHIKEPDAMDEPRNDFGEISGEFGSCGILMSEEDVVEAMREIPGYLDITPSDFQEVYKHACRHALRRIMLAVRARDIMTRDVLVVTPEMPAADVARAMASKGISGVPVVDAKREVLGVISEKDFFRLMGASEFPNFMAVVARCLTEKGCVAFPLKDKKARDIMSSPAITVQEETPAVDVARILKQEKINRLPVLDKGMHLVGIVSRADILKLPFLGG